MPLGEKEVCQIACFYFSEKILVLLNPWILGNKTVEKNGKGDILEKTAYFIIEINVALSYLPIRLIKICSLLLSNKIN